MSNSPGTVSKILWHFTGGPVWNENTNKQGESLKPPRESYKALNCILKSEELRLGQYHGIVKVIIPKKRVFNRKTKKSEVKENVPVVIKSSPVCCIADIPIQHLNYHAERYGKMAIGFHRQSVVEAGFNPVMYTLEHSSLSKTVYDGFSSIDDLDPWWAKSALKDLELEIEGVHADNEIDGDIDASEVSSAIDDMETTGEEIREYYHDILAFIETFEPKEFDSIYCEREWRSTSSFKFNTENIAMIVLPKKGKKNYLKDFLLTTTLPRSVPVLSWEDLIEH